MKLRLDPLSLIAICVVFGMAFLTSSITYLSSDYSDRPIRTDYEVRQEAFDLADARAKKICNDQRIKAEKDLKANLKNANLSIPQLTALNLLLNTKDCIDIKIVEYFDRISPRKTAQ